MPPSMNVYLTESDRHRDQASFTLPDRHIGHASFIEPDRHRRHASFTEPDSHRGHTFFTEPIRHRGYDFFTELTGTEATTCLVATPPPLNLTGTEVAPLLLPLTGKRISFFTKTDMHKGIRTSHHFVTICAYILHLPGKVSRELFQLGRHST